MTLYGWARQSTPHQVPLYGWTPPNSALCPSPMCFPGIEGGFDVEQDQYEEDVKVVIFPDRQEVTSEDLATMPDVVKERVR